MINKHLALAACALLALAACRKDKDTEPQDLAYTTASNNARAQDAFNDMMAVGMLKALQQCGLRVPRDVSMTGLENIVFSNYTNPPLTTFDQPKRFIGQKAAELILSLLCPEIGVPEQKIQVLKGKLLIRESTASPSSS